MAAWLVSAVLLNASAITLVFLIACLVVRRHPEIYFRYWLASAGTFALGVLTMSLQVLRPELTGVGYFTSGTMIFGSLSLYASGQAYRGRRLPGAHAWAGAVAVWMIDCATIAVSELMNVLATLGVLGLLLIAVSHIWFGWVFWPRKGDAPSLGAPLVAISSIGWGLHTLDAPLVAQLAPALLPTGFWLTAMLNIGLGVGMIVQIYERTHAREQELSERLSTTNQELMRAVEALTDTRAQAELSGAVAREQEALVRQIIHDLRNATQAMSLITEEIESAAGNDARILTPLATLERQVRFISNFLKEKLAWIVERRAQPGTGTELGPAFESLSACFGPIFASKGQQLQLEPPPAAAISTSAVRFEQLLGNMLRNAHQHCPPGAHVRVWTAVSDGWATFYVADDGPGISLAEQGRLGRTPPRVDGTGVGLKTVQELATEAGGLFGLVSAPGKGATFYVTLPLVWWGLRVPGAEAAGREEALKLGI